MTTDISPARVSLTDDERAGIRERLDLAIEMWAWHDKTEDTIACYGPHMGQMLYRLPLDGQTRDMKRSIEDLVSDVGALLAEVDRLIAREAAVRAQTKADVLGYADRRYESGKGPHDTEKGEGMSRGMVRGLVIAARIAGGEQA